MDLCCPFQRRMWKPTAAWRKKRAGFGGSTAPSSTGSVLKPGETVVFSWIVFKSRAHRDRVNTQVMKDQRITAMCDPKSMPFDVKRMAYGGFKVLVDA